MFTPCLVRGFALSRGAAAIATLVLAASLASGAMAANEAQASPAAVFDAAMLSYERNHWSPAYAALVELADAGHLDAARMALQMWTYGPRLYGQAFAARPEQVKHWAGLARCDLPAARAVEASDCLLLARAGARLIQRDSP